jgi:hypothetical protein
MADWEPAAGAASDLPLLVSVLRAAARTSCVGGTALHLLFGKLPLSAQLQRSDWLQILRSGLIERITCTPLMQWALGLQPELRDMSVAELAPLLEAAVQGNSAEDVAVLTALPAAQQLQPDDVERMLSGAKVRLKVELLESVAALPAAQQLSLAAYVRVLRAGVQVSDSWQWQGLQVLLKLPAAEQLDAAALGELLAVAADKGPRALPVLTALPAAQQLQPDVVFGVLQQLVRRLADASSMGFLEIGVTFVPLLQLQPAQQIPLDSLQQLFDAVTDLGPLGKNLPDLIRNLPQAGGLQERLSLKRLLPLLKQACSVYDKHSRRDGPPVGGMRLLQEPAAQELCGLDLVGLLREATGRGSDSILAGLQELPGFRLLGSKDVQQLMRTTLVERAHTKRSGLMEPYADHPAAAALTQAQLRELVSVGVEQQCYVPEFFAALMRLPAGQQLGKEQVMRLTEAAISNQCEAAVPALLASPGWQALDAAAALELLRQAGGLYAGSGAGVRSYAGIVVAAVLAGLPRAMAQLSRQQIQGLLFEALQHSVDTQGPLQGADEVHAVLARHFAARCTDQDAAAAVEGEQEGAAASGGAGADCELAAVCGAMRLLEGRTYPFSNHLHEDPWP